MKRIITLICTVVALAVGVPAQAQQAPPAPAKPPTPSSGDAAAKAEASKAYANGMKSYEAGKYDDALAEFRHSYSAYASPNSHLMIARCLQKLGRKGEAYRQAAAATTEAEAAAAKAPKYKATAESARKLAALLRSEIGAVTVIIVGRELAADMTLTVAGEQLTNVSEQVYVDPGPVTAVLESADGRVEETVTVIAGGQATIELTPAAPAAPPPPPGDGGSGMSLMRISAIAAGGVGVVGMVLFGVFGGMTMSTFGDLEDRCPNETCPADAEGDIDDGQTYRTVANVSLVVGITGLAAGATLFVLDLFVFNPNEEGASAKLPVQLSVGPGSLSVKGQF